MKRANIRVKSAGNINNKDFRSNEILLDVRGLKKYFPVKKGIFSRIAGHIKAVDEVSFTIKKGEILGLVGESGCGKTTTGRVILRLMEPTEGKVYFDGKDIYSLKRRDMRALRKEMQIIFQDPYSSLNPRITVAGMLKEAIKLHKIAEGKDINERVNYLLQLVGLSPGHGDRYPHEFSGGQRQRIGIARALSVEPKFIVADEPVSALDVSIQAQIINLLQDLQQKFNLTFLFIAHDLSVIRHISDKVAVMYLGKIVEIAENDELYKNPLHPYTKALLSAIPIPDPGRKSDRIILKGDVPNPIDTPSGCYFHPRCSDAIEDCRLISPELQEITRNHMAGCIRIPGYRF